MLWNWKTKRRLLYNWYCSTAAIMMNINDYVVKFMKIECFGETHLDDEASFSDIVCTVCQVEIDMFLVLDHIASLDHQKTYQKCCSPYEYNHFVICINQYRGAIQYPTYLENIKDENIQDENIQDSGFLSDIPMSNENEQTVLWEDADVDNFEHTTIENTYFDTVFESDDISIRQQGQLGNYNLNFIDENEHGLNNIPCAFDINGNSNCSSQVPGPESPDSSETLTDNIYSGLSPSSANEQEFQEIIYLIESKWTKIQLRDIANAAICRLMQ